MLVALWWRLARRRQGGAAALLAVLAAFSWLFWRAASVAEGTLALGPAIYRFNEVLGLGLAAVAFVPVVLRGRGVSATRRFDLLPWTPARRARLRLTLDNPGAVLSGSVGAIITLRFAVSVSGVTSLAADVQLIQIVFAFAFAVLLSDVLANHVGNRFPSLVYWLVLALASLAVEMLVDVARGAASAAPTVNVARGVAWLEIRRDAAVFPELALLGILLIGLAGLIWVEMNVRALPVPGGTDRSRRPAGQRIEGLVARMLPAKDPLQAKERSYILRPYISRNTLITSWLIVIVAYVIRHPVALVLGFGFWMLLGQNMFGYDLPLSGTTRYHLLPVSTVKVVHTRERMMWRAMAVPVFSLAVPALLFVSLANWLLLWPFFLLTSGLFFACSVGGRLVSTRFPRAVSRSTLLIHTGIVDVIAFTVIGLLVAATAVGLFVVYGIVQRATGRGVFGVSISASLTGMVWLLIYALVSRWETKNDRLVFQRTPVGQLSAPGI